jgi:polyadenylation factor subunit 2
LLLLPELDNVYFCTTFTFIICLCIAVLCCAVYEYNLQCRVWQRDFRDRRALQPDVTYYPDLQPPPSYIDNAINSVTTRFVKTATNKMRCPIFCMAWTPEGRRLVTGASSGEFTLWNGLTFNFETILQVIKF